MHPLASAPHSFKELAVHVGIVTVGILIALSLEGIRETIHEHRLVRETRKNFRLEIEPDLKQMNLELADIDQLNRATHAVVVDLPALKKDPVLLKQRVDPLMTQGWNINSSAWAGALSSGALSHMSADEVGRYAGFDYDVRTYKEFQDRALTQYIDLHSYVESRREFGPREMEELGAKLRNFEMLTHIMGHVGRETLDDMKKALPN